METEKIIKQLGFEDISTESRGSYVPVRNHHDQYATFDTLSGCFCIVSGAKKHVGIGRLPRVVDCPIIDRTDMTQGRVNAIHRKFEAVIDDDDVPMLIEKYLMYGGKLVNKQDYYGEI